MLYELGAKECRDDGVTIYTATRVRWCDSIARDREKPRSATTASADKQVRALDDAVPRIAARKRMLRQLTSLALRSRHVLKIRGSIWKTANDVHVEMYAPLKVTDVRNCTRSQRVIVRVQLYTCTLYSTEGTSLLPCVLRSFVQHCMSNRLSQKRVGRFDSTVARVSASLSWSSVFT
eukprot:30679-Pelagococcus_subviridis.AAC.4